MDTLRAFGLTGEPARPDVVAFVGGGGKSSAMFHLARCLAARGHRVVLSTTTHISAEQAAANRAVAVATDACFPPAQLTTQLNAYNQCLLVGSSPVPARSSETIPGVTPQQIDALVAQANALQLAAVLIEADGSRRRPFKAPATHEPVLPSATTLVVPVLGLDGVGRIIDERHAHRPQQVRAALGLGRTEAVRLSPALAAQLLMSAQGGARSVPPSARLLPLLNQADGPIQRATARLIAHHLAWRGYPCLIGALQGALTPQPDLETAEPIQERWGPVAVVVLAAGRSSRMGRPKQLEPIAGQALITHAVQNALHSGAQRVLVVTGAYATAVNQCLDSLPPDAVRRLQRVHNSYWESGQSSSVRSAIHALPAECGAAIFMPVDQPYVPPHLLRQLQRHWQRGALLAAPAVNGTPRGAPALFDRSLWPELLKLRGDVGGRSLLQTHRAELATVPTPASRLHDIDTPTDLPQ